MTKSEHEAREERRISFCYLQKLAKVLGGEEKESAIDQI